MNPEERQTRREMDQTSIRLCSLAGQVPTSYILSTGLKKAEVEACAAGGFADVYRGSYNELEVALKVVRVAGKRNIKRAHKVCSVSCLTMDLRLIYSQDVL